MNRQNQQDIFFKNKNLLKEKIQENNKKQNWLRERNRNKFAYFKIIAIFLSVFLTMLLSAWLVVEQSVASNPLTQEAKEGLILVRQESPQEETAPEKSPQEETAPEKSSQEETPSEKSPQEEAAPEESSQEETPSEESSQEEAQPEQKLSLEETRKSLEEEIHERYEEWESQRTGSEISHNLSAIATIIMTVLIALLGTGLVTLPHRRLIIIIVAILTVLIQFNINIFMLEKSLGGYQILEEQGLTLKNKLKTASTDEELTEVREQFQELVIESINIE